MQQCDWFRSWKWKMKLSLDHDGNFKYQAVAKILWTKECVCSKTQVHGFLKTFKITVLSRNPWVGHLMSISTPVHRHHFADRSPARPADFPRNLKSPERSWTLQSCSKYLSKAFVSGTTVHWTRKTQKKGKKILPSQTQVKRETAFTEASDPR